MSDDARLVEWLALGAAALATPAESRLDALCAAVERRAVLQRSLEAEPPGAVAPALLANLVQGEAELGSALARARADLAARLGALRVATRAHHGYRPARGSDPAFLSHDV